MKWIVLLVWLFVSSGYLYLLNFAVPEEAGWEGFLLFTILLAGGGLSYDIASKFFSIPSHRSHWRKLLKNMALVLLGHSVVLAGLFVAGYLNNSVGTIGSSIVGLCISFLGIIVASWQAYRAEETFKKLRGIFSEL